MYKVAELNGEKYMDNEKGVKDEYLEHNAYHQSFHLDCSSCWSERRLINAHKTVNKVSPWVAGSKYAGRPVLPSDDE